MFARVVEYTPKLENKDELFKMVRQEIVPMLKKQPGFLELLPLLPEITSEKFITIALWTGKTEAERFAKSEDFAKFEKMLKPFLTTPTAYTVKTYAAETTICQHLVDALTAAA